MYESSSDQEETRWPRLDPTRWLLVLWRQPVLILLVFALGSGAAFAYSYAPLHRANSWRIDYLEQRLASRNEQVAQLEEDLEVAQGALEDVPPAEALTALEARLEEATRMADEREREIASLEKKLSRSKRSLKSERAARARAEEETEVAKAAAAPPPAAVATPDPVASESTSADPSVAGIRDASAAAGPGDAPSANEPFPAAAAPSEVEPTP